MHKDDLMDKIVSLSKRRGFIFPGSEIYGGLANSWDYGPLGVELKNNIRQRWWKRFVQTRDDMVGIDAALIMNPRVWEASGHVQNFSDPLVDCKKCKERFRADMIPEDHAQTCGGELTAARQFNMMFSTHIGPVQENGLVAYLRPETAQAMFVDFKYVQETMRLKLPFGIAQAGTAFRNEITPGNFIFRTREFDLMEFEYFVRPDEWEKWFEYWLGEMKLWLKDLGVRDEKLVYHEIEDGERAHYSKRTIDIEYHYPFGQKELYGLAYRTDFDLARHASASGQDLQYKDAVTGEAFIPHVIEPAFGLSRSVLVALLEAYHEEDAPTTTAGESETRVVLQFPKWMAPIKVAVLPLSKKEALSSVAQKLAADLRQEFAVQYDATQSIGKRYRRQDEIGTPYCVTVDFESLEDNAVTVRDRDTMKQERIKIAELKDYLSVKLKA